MNETTETTVRAATAADAADLGRLGALLVGVHHDFDTDRFIAPGPRTEAGYGSFLTAQLGREDAIVLVAEQRGGVVGYAFAGIEGDDWMTLRGPAGVIYDLIVDPGARRGGIGRRLLEHTLQALRDRGAPRVLLSAAHKNERAQRLFASIGFRPTMVEMTREWPD
jgi:ribosomal protein S18 acetylase RimI-like enzyme